MSFIIDIIFFLSLSWFLLSRDVIHILFHAIVSQHIIWDISTLYKCIPYGYHIEHMHSMNVYGISVSNSHHSKLKGKVNWVSGEIWPKPFECSTHTIFVQNQLVSGSFSALLHITSHELRKFDILLTDTLTFSYWLLSRNMHRYVLST